MRHVSEERTQRQEAGCIQLLGDPAYHRTERPPFQLRLRSDEQDHIVLRVRNLMSVELVERPFERALALWSQADHGTGLGEVEELFRIYAGKPFRRPEGPQSGEREGRSLAGIVPA